MAAATTMKLALVLLVCALLAAPIAESAISCGQVTTNLSPCIMYLRGASSPAGSVPPECCTGIRTLNSVATTTPDRQTACECIKSAAATISNIHYDLAADLPANCGVDIPYEISPSTDCNSVQ